jgi:KipI family sensor histidine kinase inhibitor
MKIQPLGDAALVVQLGSRIDTDLSAKAQTLANRLRSRQGVQDALASYCSVTVHYNPDSVSYQTLRSAVERLHQKPAKVTRSGRLHRIPVIYDGPDLPDAAEALGISIAEVIQIHSSATYRVFLIGFAPGQPYLGPLPAKLQLPRRSTPRTYVPAGSVAIAGRQTNVYTWPTPGGWHVLGRTDMRLVFLDRDPPALLRAGDRVKFVPRAE